MTIQEIIEKSKPYYNAIGPHNVLYEWCKINKDLDKIYPYYNITDNTYGLNIKNSTRHFAGGALGNKFYGEDLTRKLGVKKEKFDENKNKFNKKQNLEKIQHFELDKNIDFLNNERGIEFTKQNPHVTRQEIYHKAIKNAINNYAKDYTNNSLK